MYVKKRRESENGKKVKKNMRGSDTSSSLSMWKGETGENQ